MTVLVPYEAKMFNAHPHRRENQKSKAERGLCSHHHTYGPYHATHMLVTGDRARWALCPVHAKLWSTRRELEELRGFVHADMGDVGMHEFHVRRGVSVG